MKVSYNWLKDYVDINIDPRKLADILTMAGCNVASWEKVGNDYIFDFEITANRTDLLSILGIAREIAALLGKKLKIPKELTTPNAQRPTPNAKTSFKVTVEDATLCPRYTARVISDVEVRPSPNWLKTKIISAGLRPVNNIVDITNFVLLETGQPLHAFDMDRINGTISVRRAHKGERIITIDNIPRSCDEETLLIADEKSPLAIAGIMGGVATEVRDLTRNILLESACFNPISIRRTSRRLGLSSESSLRFERRIDVDMVARASERASVLMHEIAKGRIGAFIEVGRKRHHAEKISFYPERVNSLLGVSIESKGMLKILRSLGFLVKDRKKAVIVTPPSFRGDVKSEVDLAEEVARIYGYERIPITIPRIVGNTKIREFTNVLMEYIRQILTRLGLNEIITYSLTGKRHIEGFGIKEDEIIAIKNPLSIDQEIMRPTLLAGMLRVISYNLNRGIKGLSFFEIGKIYKEKENSYREDPVLSLGLVGIKREDWKTAREKFDFFDVKGVIEKLLKELGLTEEVLFKKATLPGFKEGIASVVEYRGEIVASAGEVDPACCNRFDIKKRVFYGEVYIQNLKGKIHLDRRYSPPSRYPSVTRDISIVHTSAVTSYEIRRIIREIGKNLVKDVSVVDLYRGGNLPEGKSSFLYRIEYRSDEKTLEDSEVEKLHSAIKDALSERLGVSFRLGGD